MIDEGSYFWMGGRLGRGLLEMGHDLGLINDWENSNETGSWAVLIDYEGNPTCLRFAEVAESPFPQPQVNWKSLTTPWRSTLDAKSYQSYVQEMREQIASGELYQANACRILSNQTEADLAPLFVEMLQRNPSPYSAFLSIPGLQIASASPELFLQRTGDRIITSPIKGTSQSPDFGEKDRAENIMIADLMRNDLGKICMPGSVMTPRLLATEEHPGLFHLVTDVSGQLRAGISWKEILAALLPAGSISGAPKLSAQQVIAQHEGVRGPYCGVMGWIDEGSAILSVLIRTFWKSGGDQLKFGTGAGITWGSDPQEEWNETVLKAARFMAIVGGGS